MGLEGKQFIRGGPDVSGASCSGDDIPAAIRLFSTRLSWASGRTHLPSRYNSDCEVAARGEIKDRLEAPVCLDDLEDPDLDPEFDWRDRDLSSPLLWSLRSSDRDWLGPLEPLC